MPQIDQRDVEHGPGSISQASVFHSSRGNLGQCVPYTATNRIAAHAGVTM